MDVFVGLGEPRVDHLVRLCNILVRCVLTPSYFQICQISGRCPLDLQRTESGFCLRYSVHHKPLIIAQTLVKNLLILLSIVFLYVCMYVCM